MAAMLTIAFAVANAAGNKASQEIDVTYWTDVQSLFSVSFMQYDISVLRAILRLSRHRRTVDQASLVLRVEGDDANVRGALRRLESQGLIVRSADTTRLTMMGLAVGLASRAHAHKCRASLRTRKAA